MPGLNAKTATLMLLNRYREKITSIRRKHSAQRAMMLRTRRTVITAMWVRQKNSNNPASVSQYDIGFYDRGVCDVPGNQPDQPAAQSHRSPSAAGTPRNEGMSVLHFCNSDQGDEVRALYVGGMIENLLRREQL